MTQNEKASRREFLQLAGAAAAGGGASLAVAGCGSGGEGLRTAAPVSITKETDLLIIGAGAGGLWAAYEASKTGLNTLVVEKQPRIGGDSLMSCGILFTKSTKIVKEAGVAPYLTPEEAFQERHEYFSKRRVPELGQSVLTYGSGCIDTWTDEFDIKWKPFVTGKQRSNVGYYHLPEPGMGNAKLLFEPLYKAAKSGGVEFQLKTKAVGFIVDQNNVAVGLRVQNLDSGAFTDIRARRFLMSCGDFVSNRELMSEYMPRIARYPCATNSSMGEGLLMSQPLGASLERMEDKINLVGSNPDVGLWATWDSVMFVNPRGERFEMRQFGTRKTRGLEDLAEAGHYNWYTILDEENANGFCSHSIGKAIDRGALKKADSVAELADELCLPVERLRRTMDRYNTLMASGEDSDWQRPYNLRPLEPPFYSENTRLMRYKTYGGVRLNPKCQVIDAAGNPVPNLYAAGSVTGSVTPNIIDVIGLAVLATREIAKELKA